MSQSLACWQKTLEPTLYVNAKTSADQRLMVALLLIPPIFRRIVQRWISPLRPLVNRNNQWTKKPVNRFLQDSASAGTLLADLCCGKTLPNAMEWTSANDCPISNNV